MTGDALDDVVGDATPAADRALDIPMGRRVELPGRGTTFVREVEGPPGAPTLILLHGWIASGGINWFQVFEPLGRQFRVIAPDLRGHGRGLRTNRRFRLADCADDVAALMDVLGIDEAIMVGYSMGGPVAQLLWHRHRDKVAGLVLCATSATFRGTPREWVLSRLATGGSLVAATPPFQPVLAAATTVMRTWQRAPIPGCGGEVFGHDFGL